MADTITHGRRAIRHGAMAALCAVLLAGCSGTTQLQRSASNARVGAVEAIALPPPGGPAVIDVVERRYANAVQQDIALGTRSRVAGQNLLRIQLFGPMGAEAGQTRLSNLPLTEASIRREMRALLPGVAMQVSALFVQNNYGPFGYAFGRSGRDLCLYAWQRVSAPRTAAPFNLRGTMQTRLRLCETGASERALLEVMYGYTVTGGFAAESWNPFGNPPPPDERLGRTSNPVFPAGNARFETVLEPEPVVLRPANRRVVVTPAPARPAALPPEPQPIAPGAPVVPPPPTSMQPAPVVPAPPPASETTPNPQ